MKFKNILSLTLATTIAFTATLSSSASIFADDVEIPQTEESQSFGSLILEKIKSNCKDLNEGVISIGNSNNDGQEISPLWTGSVHDEIVEDGGSQYLPSEYLPLIEKICKWCDDETKISFSTCIHGNRNYAATLKFLWKFAQVIGDKSISGTYSQLSANAKNVALAQFNNKGIINNQTDYEGLLDLATRTEAIINQYGKAKTPEERKYLIFGVIFHFFGDVTAHRTVVPQFLVDRATDPNYANNPNKLNKSDFSTTGWETIKAGVKNKSLDFTHLQYYFRADYDGNKLTAYEDNPKVVPNRVLESITMVDYFLRTFDNGFNVIIFDVIPYENVSLVDYTRYRNQG